MVWGLELRAAVRSCVGVHNSMWRAGGLRQLNVASGNSPPQRIAIVGAGIGGTATAYYLRQQFGKHVQIDIFESGKIGGRLATATVKGNEYEVGGTVIHPRNLHMKDFVKQLGLKEREVIVGHIGIYDGEKLTFEENSLFLVNVLKLLWRYGFNLLRLKIWLNGILEKFTRIYRYQLHEYSFTTVEKMLYALGGDEFISMTQTTIEEVLRKAEYSQKFIDEMVTPIMRVNYCQNKTVNAFVGAVSLAGAQPNLWAVDGGNRHVCQGLINASSAELVEDRVTAVECQNSPSGAGDTFSRYALHCEKSDSSYSLYDIVVVATPLHKGMTSISFQNFSHPISDFSGKYHQTVTTIVYGLLNVSFFGYKNPSKFTLNEILTVENPRIFINSIGALSPVTVSADFKVKVTEPAAWKIFSPEPLTEEQLDLLFVSYSNKFEKAWLAYPNYTPPEMFPPIILHENMYYLNAIERAASAMEMSAIAAKNIALLAHHHWFQKTDKIDQENLKI